MQIIEINTDELIPYANNPRINDEAVDMVAASIKEFGFKQPIVIDAEKVIVAGHTRLRAAKKLGLEKVPCIMADDLTEQQIKAYRLADNKVGELATWDLEKLDIELESISDLDMVDFGFADLTAARNDGLSVDWDEDGGTSGSLVENFIIPPFSVLDTRQGYWKDRKKHGLKRLVTYPKAATASMEQSVIFSTALTAGQVILTQCWRKSCINGSVLEMERY